MDIIKSAPSLINIHLQGKIIIVKGRKKKFQHSRDVLSEKRRKYHFFFYIRKIERVIV